MLSHQSQNLQQQFKNLKNSSNPLRNKYPEQEKPKRTLKKKHRIEQRVRKERERVTDSGHDCADRTELIGLQLREACMREGEGGVRRDCVDRTED